MNTNPNTTPPNQATFSIIAPKRPIGKKPLELILSLIVLPRLLCYRILRRLIGQDRALSYASESVATKPGPLGTLYRAAFFKRILQYVGHDVSIGFGTCFSRNQAVLEDRVYLGRYCSVGLAHIGQDTHIADHVQILSGNQQHTQTDGSLTLKQITIGKNVWIGAGAIIMADIADNTTIGAGAVVTKNIPANSVFVGNPARPIQPICPINTSHEDHDQHIRSRVA